MSVDFFPPFGIDSDQQTLIALHGWGQKIGGWIDYLNFEKMSGLTQFCSATQRNLVYPISSNRTWYAVNTWNQIKEKAKKINSYVRSLKERSPEMFVTLAGFSDGGRIAQVCLAMEPDLYNHTVIHSARFSANEIPYVVHTVKNKRITVVVGDNDFKFNRHDAELIVNYYRKNNSWVERLIVPDLGHAWAKSWNPIIFSLEK